MKPINDQKKSRFARPRKEMDPRDRVVNMMFFIMCCKTVHRFSQKHCFVVCVAFGILGLWFLKNELLYGRK